MEVETGRTVRQLILGLFGVAAIWLDALAFKWSLTTLLGSTAEGGAGLRALTAVFLSLTLAAILAIVAFVTLALLAAENLFMGSGNPVEMGKLLSGPLLRQQAQLLAAVLVIGSTMSLVPEGKVDVVGGILASLVAAALAAALG